jgi:hypothetical protein
MKEASKNSINQAIIYKMEIKQVCLLIRVIFLISF